MLALAGLLTWTRAHNERMPKDTLSERELQILEMASSGLTDQAIANKLEISLATVSTYWTRIRGKYGHVNRAELVANFIRKNDQVEVNALKDSLATFEALIDGAPDPMIIVDPDGVIQRANKLAAELFLWDQDAMSGMRIGKLMHESLHEAHREYRKNYLASNGGRIEICPITGAEALRSDGTPIRVEIHLNTAMTPNGKMIVCIMRPVN